MDEKDEIKSRDVKKLLRRIKNEIIRLRSIFNEIDKNKLKAVNSIIENVAFMTITLQDLQDDIVNNGLKEQYKNGRNQWGMRENPAIGSYNTMITKYSTLMKQLTDLMSEESTKDLDDGFDDFLNG